MQASNGDILLAGTAGTIWLVYLTSYMYYEYEKEQEIKVAEAKRQKTPTKPKKEIAQPEKQAPVERAKDPETNDNAVDVQAKLQSNLVIGRDATDTTRKSEENETIMTTDEMVTPPIKTEASNPLIEPPSSDSSEPTSRRLGWIRFWRRKQ